MKLVETIEVDTPGEIQILDYVTLDPTKSGITFCAKSQVIADWVQSILPKGAEPVKGSKWSGQYWPIGLDMVKWPANVCMDTPNGELVRSTGGNLILNLAWVRHTKLAEGIELKVPIMSAADYEDYLPALADAVRLLYVQNIRRNVMTLKMKEVLK